MPTPEPTYLNATQDILEENIRAGDVLEIHPGDEEYRILRRFPMDRLPRLLPHLWAFTHLRGPSLPTRPQPEPVNDPDPVRLVK